MEGIQILAHRDDVVEREDGRRHQNRPGGGEELFALTQDEPEEWRG